MISWIKAKNLSSPWVQCKCCNEPMRGIMDLIARHTCSACGGFSLIATDRKKQRGELKEKKYRHRAYIPQSDGGNVA